MSEKEQESQTEELQVQNVARDEVTEPQDTETSDETPAETPEEASDEAISLEETIRSTYAFAESWSDVEVQQWYQQMGEAKSPYVEGTDVLVFDPQREKRKAGEWTTEELKAFVNGRLKHVQDFRKRELIDELRRHINLEPAWSYNEVLDYYRKGIEPTKTTTGAYLNDVTRAGRSPSDWSNAELEAWALGEIKAEGKATANKLSAVLKERFGLITRDNDPKTIIVQFVGQREAANAQTTSLPESGLNPMNESYIDSVLERYRNAVMPGREISDETGGRAQRELDNLFNYVLRLQGPAMLQGLQRIKTFVSKHRQDLFAPTNAHRFSHLLKGDRNAQRRHVNFIELLLIVTDPNKAKRKQVDMRAMLKEHPTQLQEILHDYFRNYA